MSQEEMKKLTAMEMMVQETTGVLGRHSEVSDAIRSMGIADPLSSHLPFQATPYPVGPRPTPVGVGDFNNDGKLDIVTANYGGNTVTILLNNGDGTFTAAPGSPPGVGQGPYALAVGDFNNDGNLDIVTANYDDNTVTVLLGNGDGTFAAAPGSPPSVGTNPTSVAVGDFNNDGNLDIVTVNYGDYSNGADGTITVLLGNGDGTFTAAPGSPISFNFAGLPWGIGVGDFNNDGNLDIVTTIPASTIYGNQGVAVVLLGNGNGTFQSPQAWGAEDIYCYNVAVGDFNNDGKWDIVTTNYYSNNIAVWLNNGDNTFQSARFYDVGQEPIGVAVGDFNNDGNLDIVTANSADGTVTVLLGNGDGTFATPIESPYSVGQGPWSVAVGDFLNNREPGIVATNNGDNTVTVLLQLPVVQVNTIHATVNVPFNGAVAIIRGARSANDTTATINWGDGTPNTSGTVSANSDGTLTVSGSHTYTTPGTYTLYVIAEEGPNVTSGYGQAMVQSATGVQVVQVNTIHASAHVPFHGTVATINGAFSANDTTVTINWGDGSAATPGTVVPNHDGTLRVSGSHTYSRGGTFPLTVSVREGTRTATGSGQAIVKATHLHARAFGGSISRRRKLPLAMSRFPRQEAHIQ
ncbi:FG-GAP repeat domain-containing protein [Ktedonospora formicarum]|uniref:PKD domain-containing protein n=1 Tax=Ktedonospora formicarum TaxID=2778364 RepID=A0A8J3I3D2_9CHLR|nr:VCBS repeat-containing protein [Ktedonospora formicarum]GHO48554.1 hypothetical protein KSX_67170 [Ktedonospora formicarum]